MEQLNNIDYNLLYEEAKDSIAGIKKLRCPNCGSNSFSGSKCNYCQSNNKQMEVYIHKLEKVIEPVKNIRNIPINKLFNSLVLIMDNEIPLVDELINNSGYYQRYNNYYNEIVTQLNNYQHLDDVAINVVSNKVLFDNNCKDNLALYNNLICRIIEEVNNVDYTTFLEAIKKLVIGVLEADNMRGKCEIVQNEWKSNRKCLGSACIEIRIIEIDEEYLKFFYETGKGIIPLFEAIWHEIRHFEQFYFQKTTKQKTDEWSILMLKEGIMQKYNGEYYKENYDRISFEVDAHYYSIEYMMNYFKSIGIIFPTFEQYLLEEKEKYRVASFNMTRTINGVPVNIEEEFIKVLSEHPDELLTCPALAARYEIVDGQINTKALSENENDGEDYESKK